MIIGNPVFYHGNNYTVRFILKKVSSFGRTIGISVNLTSSGTNKVKWAVLQVFIEEAAGKTTGLKIDGPGWLPKCLTTLKRPNSEPPYCAFFDSHSGGALTIFDDLPHFDCKGEGSIRFYTIFSEMTTNGTMLNPFSCTYEIRSGVKWGIKRVTGGRIEPIALEEMSIEEYEEVLNVFRTEYPTAVFLKV